MSIAVIAGLGNPGPKYRNTRHNIGYEVVDQLASQHGIEWRKESRFESEVAVLTLAERKLMLIKPLTFMNDSGRALGAVLRYRKLGPEALLVVYDDITLDLARAKLSLQGSAGGHNGIADLLQRVGPGFARYRIGIGGKPNKEMDLADYVLSKFRAEEAKSLSESMANYIEQIGYIVENGLEPALNLINQRTSTSHERNNNEPI